MALLELIYEPASRLPFLKLRPLPLLDIVLLLLLHHLGQESKATQLGIHHSCCLLILQRRRCRGLIASCKHPLFDALVVLIYEDLGLVSHKLQSTASESNQR